jgi:hypothetical protein
MESGVNHLQIIANHGEYSIINPISRHNSVELLGMQKITSKEHSAFNQPSSPSKIVVEIIITRQV